MSLVAWLFVLVGTALLGLAAYEKGRVDKRATPLIKMNVWIAPVAGSLLLLLGMFIASRGGMMMMGGGMSYMG